MADLKQQGHAKRMSGRSVGDPTIADVAARAGVSTMTVSRVVNKSAGVRPATREKVEAAIAELGFVPNAAARSLAGGKACRIALLHSNPSAAYLSEFLVGSLAGAAEADAQLVVEHWIEQEQPRDVVDRLAGHRIDAVLLPPPLCDAADLIEHLRVAGFALAQIATGAPAAFADAVSIDDESAAFAMTGRLLGLGHRRIGFIVGDRNQTASTLRLQGYRRALTEAGLAVDDTLIAQGDFTYRSGLLACGVLLGQTDRPSAIFASNDDMAAAAIAAASRRGLDVPRHLAVCGFDDSAMASTTWPEITTVRQPIAAMAQLATTQLAKRARARGDDAPLKVVHQVLAHHIVVRDSDGPVADHADGAVQSP